jgi:hypothetical protein
MNCLIGVRRVGRSVDRVPLITLFPRIDRPG